MTMWTLVLVTLVAIQKPRNPHAPKVVADFL